MLHLRQALDSIEKPSPKPGPDKTTTLSNAIQRLVKPGMTLHFATSHNRPGAATIELVRAFRGQKPGFTLSCLGFTSNGVVPVHAGIVAKLIATFCGDSYPTPGPNPVIDRAWRQGQIAIENWTILTLPLRLLAGAMGVPFLPTRSMVGSSMARENAHAFREIEEGGERFGLVSALRPDLAFIHAPMADRAGNVILTPPFGEDALGCYAARHGVIVSVDKIVDTDFIRRYSHLCKIPSTMVAAVCETPFGAHPGGVSRQGLPEFDSYADDYDFVLEIRKAARAPESMEQWVKEWIDDCPAWENYLEKLGRDRIWMLKGKAHPDSWKSELADLASEIDPLMPAGPVEEMAVAAGAIIAERVREGGLTSILAGVGTSNLAAWLAYYRLLKLGVEVDLMAELGFHGYLPRPADPFIFNFRNMPTAKMLTGIMQIMGVFMAGAGNRCIGSVGSGQVDKRGNLNTTMIPGVAYLTGSGGGNDICSAAREVVVTALSGKGRFVSELPYLTSPGRAVRAVVSDVGVFEKYPGDDELVLSRVFAFQGTKQEAVAEAKAACGWPLKIADRLETIDPPDQEELTILRMLDPRRQFLGKR